MFLESTDSCVKVRIPFLFALANTCSRAPGSSGTTRMASTPLAIWSSTMATCWAGSASAGFTMVTSTPPRFLAARCIPINVFSNMG